MPWPSGRPSAARHRAISPCWSRTCWCRRRSAAILRIAGQSRAGVPRAGPRLRGDGLGRIRAARRAATGCPSSSPASSRSTCSKASCMPVRQLEAGRAERRKRVRARGARAKAIPRRTQMMDEVFEVCDRKWRGIGAIPQSGYRLRAEYRDYDAEHASSMSEAFDADEPADCISGQILQGLEEAARLPGVRAACTPENAAGRDHGVGGGRLRRLLRLRPAPRCRRIDSRQGCHGS